MMGYFDFASTAGASQSRAAMIVFGNTAIQQWDLTTYASSTTANSQLVQAVNSLPYLNSDGTDIVRYEARRIKGKSRLKRNTIA